MSVGYLDLKKCKSTCLNHVKKIKSSYFPDHCKISNQKFKFGNQQNNFF